MEAAKKSPRTPLFPVTLNIQEEWIVRLERAAEAAGISRHSALKQCLVSWLERQESKAAEGR